MRVVFSIWVSASLALVLSGWMAKAEPQDEPDITGFLDSVSADTLFEPGAEGVSWTSLAKPELAV